MRFMNWKYIGIILCVLASGVAEAKVPQSVSAKQCGVNMAEPANRVFAKVTDGQPWRGYKQIEDVPTLDLGSGMSAQLWKGRNGNLLVRTVEPGEDFWAYTEYCFSKGGQLEDVTYELRTAWGWAFRIEGPIKHGSLDAKSKGFFSTETEKPMARPSGADDIPEALKPRLYLKANELPFSGLINR